jgi:hypothetical protein
MTAAPGRNACHRIRKPSTFTFPRRRDSLDNFYPMHCLLGNKISRAAQFMLQRNNILMRCNVVLASRSALQAVWYASAATR